MATQSLASNLKVQLLMGIIIALTIALYLSIGLPYFTNPAVDLFFFTVAPLCIFLLLGSITIFKKSDGRFRIVNIYRGEMQRVRGGLSGAIIAVGRLAILSLLFSVLLKNYLAYPTKVAAIHPMKTFAVIEDIQKKTGLDHAGFSRVILQLKENEHIDASVLMPTPDTASLNIGDCVNVVGRTWLLGSYVERLDETPCSR